MIKGISRRLMLIMETTHLKMVSGCVQIVVDGHTVVHTLVPGRRYVIDYIPEKPKLVVSKKVVDTNVAKIIANELSSRNCIGLARRLGVADDQPYQMLCAWINHNGTNATHETLAKALVNEKFTDIAQLLAKP